MIPAGTVLAAVDFSDSSRVALMFAGRLAAQIGAQLHVLHVQEPRLTAAARSAGVSLERETREELEHFVASTKGIPDLMFLHVVVGPATDAICDIACREQADLIVLGVHGLSPAPVALGSTTEGVLRHAAVSVVVVPEDWRPPQPTRSDLRDIGPVVAAVDRSEPSLVAAAAGARLAGQLGTSLELVHVIPGLPALDRWQAHADAAVATEYQAVGRDVVALVRGLHLTSAPALRVVVGQVAEQLVTAAARGPGRDPLLVMGRRCPGHRDGAPGSIAVRVLTRTQVPVLVHVYGSEPD